MRELSTPPAKKKPRATPDSDYPASACLTQKRDRRIGLDYPARQADSCFGQYYGSANPISGAATPNAIVGEFDSHVRGPASCVSFAFVAFDNTRMHGNQPTLTSRRVRSLH